MQAVFLAHSQILWYTECKLMKEDLRLENKVKIIRQPLKLKNLLMLLISGTVNAFGVTMFLTPVGLYDSGISGTSM